MQNPVNRIERAGVPWVPIYCANCGADGGLVPEENCDFAFYLCDEKANNCAAKWGNWEGTYLEPDAIFWMKVKQEQIERYGRELSPPEMVEALKDATHPMSKLAKDRRK